MRRFFRFSIRDLFWLTLVVAVGMAWLVRERQLRAQTDQAHDEHQEACRLHFDQIRSLEDAVLDWTLCVEWNLADSTVSVYSDGTITFEGGYSTKAHFEPSSQNSVKPYGVIRRCPPESN